ncbi:hypothetical protein BYZ73_16555 [Rhodovulum viride]|uniref:Uncharacterized protein n=1 Tax=Rhodovulum viride TaxID=1231134 RepID=A0ABX9DCV0_9RHOB|nr:hypothetical protein [Rhodovulum viride]RAP40150.1 hypothetical protein BYZ73_16555 [Rhodovulum viride]
MAEQFLVWTVLPYGRVADGGEHDGKWRVSLVVSPRLTPQAPDEQVLKAYEPWLDWPATLERANFRGRIGSTLVRLTPVSKPDSALWKRFFTEETPVAGFVYTDMSRVNLRSYAVRNVLAFARRHYGRLAAQSGDEHPVLLPWKDADPALKGMLGDLGTRTQIINFGDRSVEVPLPGFSRFFGDDIDKILDRSVFSDHSVFSMAVPGPGVEGETGTPDAAESRPRRALPPDWVPPAAAGAAAGVMGQFTSADEYTFYQADRFYRRTRASDLEKLKRRPDFKDVTPPPPAPEYDFHRIVASYADYGDLKRGLGLVIDCVLDTGKVIDDRIAAGGGTGIGQMQLALKWDGPAPGKDAMPRTAWLARKDRFVPRPRSAQHDAGLLRLEDSDDGWQVAKDEKPGLFDLYQVDPDGAALKTVNFALTAQNLVARSLSLRQSHGEVTYTTPDRQGVAALRSGGIGVSQHGRATDLAQLAAAADLKNAEIAAGNADKVVLFAEDVHRGYRIDVARVPDRVHPGDWQSLQARVGDYRVISTGEQLKFPPDEGYVSGHSVSGDPDNADEQYLHESLFRWSGWSLAAPRPGRTIRSETGEDDNLQAELPADVTDTAEKGNDLAVTFAAQKGSLPRLRFGALYRLRARVVDLAGNSLGLKDPSLGDLEQASDAVGYWRFEPVDPPVLVQRERLSEGEQLERLVIRSNFNATTGEYLNDPDFQAAAAEPASADFAYTETNQRHLVPPKSSQQQCETHGFFDPFFGDWQRIREGYAIAAREAGTLYDPLPGAQIELITPQTLGAIATTAAVPPALPSADNPVGDRMAGGQYVIHREAALTTPYLPDGATGGISIRAARGHALPGIDDEMVLGPSARVVRDDRERLILLVRHGGDWPNLAGFRLVLAERAETDSDLPCAVDFPDRGLPVWDEDKRELTLFVEKGRIVRLLYASFVSPRHLDSFGIPHWTESAKAAEACRKAASMGTNWLMTPYRPLTLVHATQAPVCRPEMIQMITSRGRGDRELRLSCRQVRLHGPSTGKIEIEADWSEWVDDIAKPRPERVAFRGQLGEVRLAENHPNALVLSTAVSAQLTDPEAKRGDVHDLGDTRFRLIAYRMRATTRFREYLPPALYGRTDLVTQLGPVALGEAMALPPEDDMGAPVLPDPAGSTAQTRVLASAPPKDPRLLYVVPTFRWSRSTGATGYTATRTGNGLRVWLDRPWFSSGDGELLGVVLHRDGGNFNEIPERYEKLVTQWGTDPLWQSPAPKQTIRDADFPARVTAETLALQEQRPGDPSVRIVGHRVHWDDDRRLWYCDIELSPGSSYMPFVRLALVRYQPNAMPGARISRVVLAEFAQVLPRRRVRATRSGSVLSVSLHGPDPESGPLRFDRDSAFQNVSFVNGPFETGRNRVEIVLQRQKDGIDSDLAWEDVQVLHDHVVGEEEEGGIGPVFSPGGLSAARDGVLSLDRPAGTGALSATVSPGPAGGRIVTPAAGGRVTLPPAEDRSLAIGRALGTAMGGTIGDLVTPTRPIDPFLPDPAFWDASVTLPGGAGPRRILVREFERFYSDNTVNERHGGRLFPRRIIEERLVFAETFDPEALLVR